ncbi:(Dimethylallyl)adenosine tRNA methylthiotransferase MiaB [bacterium BMS3Abin07]|nr:(Dimethylallyl)adenosine tRNA methylthiotransferase MiaB [bacterium BMS3Abin07]
MKKVYIKTFGCQMNVHDSERMLGTLRKEGHVPVNDPGEADLIIFNTCSIRQKAEQKFYSALGRTKHLKKRNPSLKIAVAGCIAQQEGEGMMKRVPYVDFVIGPQNIDRVSDTVMQGFGIFTDENPDLALADDTAERDNAVRGWVNIMYGCNNFCSYCVVPYTRGREKSRPVANIINEISELSAKGYREVTLLGQNVNSYSGEVSFPDLLNRISAIGRIERIRFVTSHPKDLGEKLVSAIKNVGKVCEHIHLPMQSGSTKILNLMNRKYTIDSYMDKIRMLRHEIPGIAITSDIIVGFPGETEDDHQATLSAIKEIEFDGIFAFKYSPRPMTGAAGMQGHIGEDVKSKRLAQVFELQDVITLKKNKALEGREMEVLVEDADEGNKYSGRTRTNKIVNFSSERDISPGAIITIRIEKSFRHSLSGIIVE